MKSIKTFLACALIGLWAGSAAAATQPKDPKAAKDQTNAVPNVLEQEIPKSVYALPNSPKEGRNPFFPQSAQVVAQPVKSAAPIDGTLFVLNGITPSGPKRTAMINGKTFEAGESAEIRLPAGNKVLIKCEEIRADSVVIIVDGVRRELKMRFGI